MAGAFFVGRCCDLPGERGVPVGSTGEHKEVLLDGQAVASFTFEYNDDVNLYSLFPTMTIYLYNR